MKVRFNTNRKELVQAIAKITESKPKYLGAPTFAYEIAEFRANRDGTVESQDEYALKVLIEALAFEGFLTKEAEMPYEREESNLSISLPSIPDEAMTNLINMVAAKQELLKQALQTDDLTIIQEGEKITFPWFKSLGPDETNAYMLLLTKMVEVAKSRKRINMKSHKVENAKYSFRCFLLGLGFIGDEYKGARKVLLKNLDGSSAFKNK
jgi:hypothetical protein